MTGSAVENESEPRWLTAFVDLTAEDHARGTAFWQAVTGYAVSGSRGTSDEFATLVPPDGDDHLRVQRLREGPSRVHLDLHVADPSAAARRAVGLGAVIVAEPGHVILRSPGGLPFCFVTQPGHDVASRVASPVTWPGGQRSRVDQVCVDIPERVHAAETAFWRKLTGWPLRVTARPEYARLAVPSRLPVRLLLQRLGEPSGPVRAHLDLATDDRPAEVRRLLELGAAVVGETSNWTALRPPVGPPLCVTDRNPDTGMM